MIIFFIFNAFNNFSLHPGPSGAVGAVEGSQGAVKGRRGPSRGRRGPYRGRRGPYRGSQGAVKGPSRAVGGHQGAVGGHQGAVGAIPGPSGPYRGRWGPYGVDGPKFTFHRPVLYIHGINFTKKMYFKAFRNSNFFLFSDREFYADPKCSGCLFSILSIF